MKRNEHDITELLFPLEELSETRKEELRLYHQAEKEVDQLLGKNAPPIERMKKVEEIYYSYKTGKKREYVI